THVGNSLIFFYPGGHTCTAVPGSIKYNVMHEGEVHFAVQHQLPASEDVPDMFSHYPHFPASLYSAKLSDILEFVWPSWVVCHFAWWQYSQRDTVILRLHQV
ncbi:hypothetical protein F5J12DRAFT_703798, partial [Pisolithus orientalis]|uniref:uncharacterized protein n=1 Tax=Pisolithus orientalis TaxID=936130 RepID=UPI002225513E